MREVELKFIVDRKTSLGLWDRMRTLKLVEGEPSTRLLRSVYFDTPDHALKAAGISIRLRRDEDGWTQTVKAGRTISGGLSKAEEVDIPAPDGKLHIDEIPVAKLRKAILRCTQGQSLRPICETAMKRSSGELVLANGARAELALDIGDIRAGDASAELREIEIELREGEPASLYDLARALLPDGSLRFSRRSKAERGYLLAEHGAITSPANPAGARKVALRPTWDAELAAQEVLRACFDQIAANIIAVLELDDPEGVHQLRVGLRGLRSSLSVFRSVLTSPELSRLGDEARWLGREIGRLRDLDVVGNDIVRPEAEAYPDETSLAELKDVLTELALHERARVRGLLTEQRVQAFLLDLSQFVETRGWQSSDEPERTPGPTPSAGELARAALSRRWRNVRRRAKRIDALDEEQRHELRKQLKKMRYAAEFLSSLFPGKKVKPFIKRLKRLQNVFGDLNDVAITRDIFNSLQPAGTQDLSSQRAMGWVIGAGSERAKTSWINARALWVDLNRIPAFWR